MENRMTGLDHSKFAGKYSLARFRSGDRHPAWSLMNRHLQRRNQEVAVVVTE